MIHPVICNPVLNPLVDVLNPVGWRAGSSYPAALALLYDADKAPTRELTGKGHKFNSSILSPQYQRNADGSYTDVGAQPAVDSFDGEKWLRSCGAVTNLLWAGSENFTGWNLTTNLTNTESTIGSIPSRRMTVKANGSSAYLARELKPANFAPFFSILVKKGNADWIFFGFNKSGDHGCYFNLATGTVGASLGTAQGSIEPLGNGIFRLNLWSTTVHADFLVTPPRPCDANNVLGVTAGQYVDIAQFQLTATAYPVPYTPPGTTMPASNATATNGCWFTLANGSPVWKALTGKPLTLATRVRMGVGSGDLPNSSVLNIVTPDDVAGRFLTIQKSAGGVLTANLSDGTNTATVPLAAWSRGDVLQFFPQVKAGAAQMRIGYKTAAASSITGGDLATYAGSFGPDTTLDKLMLGYANIYPMWFDKIALWNTQADDATILKWMKP